MGMGSSGGGGSSGKVEYPAYLQTLHSSWLDKAGTDTIESSITAVMNTALGSSPFTSAAAYDPSTVLATAEASLVGLIGLSLPTVISDTLSNFTTVATLMDTLVPFSVTDTLIAAEVEAYSDILDNEITVKSLPKFQRGMQDVNAVQSSSFVIGSALLYAEKTRQVAKFTADLLLKSNSDRNQLLPHIIELEQKAITVRQDFYKVIAQYAVEFARISIVAKKEEADTNLGIEEKDATWDLRVFQHGGNLMAAISGAAATVNSQGTSFGSVLGGVFSGVASGAMVGSAIPGVGTGVGAAVGGVLGGISSIFG